MNKEEIENKIIEGVHTHNIRDILGLPAEHNPQYTTIVKTTIKPKRIGIYNFLKEKCWTLMTALGYLFGSLVKGK